MQMSDAGELVDTDTGAVSQVQDSEITLNERKEAWRDAMTNLKSWN